MRWRWLGLILLLTSLVIGCIIAADVKTLDRKEAFAELEDGAPVVDRVVDVPSWNSTEGWIGFNAILPHKGKAGYEAYGLILPNDGDPEPGIAMRVVNETGLSILRFDYFSEFAWNITKVYAEAYLDKNRRHDAFKFLEVDESYVYVFLFRGLKEEAQARPILISVKEAWSEEKTLMEPTVPNLLIVVSIAAVGLYLMIRKPRLSHKGRLKKTR